MLASYGCPIDNHATELLFFFFKFDLFVAHPGWFVHHKGKIEEKLLCDVTYTATIHANLVHDVTYTDRKTQNGSAHRVFLPD